MSKINTVWCNTVNPGFTGKFFSLTYEFHKKCRCHSNGWTVFLFPLRTRLAAVWNHTWAPPSLSPTGRMTWRNTMDDWRFGHLSIWLQHISHTFTLTKDYTLKRQFLKNFFLLWCKTYLRNKTDQC